jgi:hypothetical protein
MTNIFNHHLHRITLPQSDHPASGQQSLVVARTPVGKLVEAAPPASPRVLPLDAASGIARESARQEAPHKPQSTEAFSTPSHAPQRGYSRPLHKGPAALHVEISNSGASEPRPETQRPLGGVRQDKARVESARVASPQPAPVTKVTRTRFSNTSRVRSQNATGARRERVTLWVDPLVKAEVERIADREGLSVSAAGAAFLHQSLQKNADLQYGALLTPVIERAIARQMRGIATRLAWLLVRVAFDAGQTRSLVTNILGRQPGVSQSLLKTILDGSARTAKANITRRTPQIESLIEAVEHWIKEGEKEDRAK